MTYLNKDISAALKSALEAKGDDYVYDNNGACVYAIGGEPSCIVGHVLKEIDPEAFQRVVNFEQDYQANRGDNSFRNVVMKLNLQFNRDQARALARMQQKQDTGSTWGSAVAVEWIGALGERLPDSVPDGVDIHGEES